MRKRKCVFDVVGCVTLETPCGCLWFLRSVCGCAHSLVRHPHAEQPFYDKHATAMEAYRNEMERVRGALRLLQLGTNH